MRFLPSGNIFKHSPKNYFLAFCSTIVPFLPRPILARGFGTAPHGRIIRKADFWTFIRPYVGDNQSIWEFLELDAKRLHVEVDGACLRAPESGRRQLCKLPQTSRIR